MNTQKPICFLMLLIGIIGSSSVFARDHRGVHPGYRGGHRSAGFYGGFYGPGISFYSGPGFGYGWRQPYYPPYYYAPPPVITVQPASPPIYIERAPQPVAPQQLQPNYWYYCRNPEGYYPYVKQCLGNWEPVAPQPPVR